MTLEPGTGDIFTSLPDEAAALYAERRKQQELAWYPSPGDTP